MTSITTVLALVPMALDFNEGFEIRIPLALTLIGGLIFGTFLTLIFIPLVYSMVVRETKATEEKQSRFMSFLKSFKMTPSLDKVKAKKP
jgi:HAE1 family hydrophobic/amphiphilic exporter-1